MPNSGRRLSTTLDARGVATIQHEAVASFFQIFEDLAEGAVMVDRDARITWIDSKYMSFLGLPDDAVVVGRPIEEVVPGTRMPEVLRERRPIPFDLMKHGRGWCVVSRFPLLDAAGQLLGGFGFVMFPDLTPLRPAYEKMRQLERAPGPVRETAVRKARYTFAQFVGETPVAKTIKRQARQAATVNSTVLIVGETGTGKELIAQAIHAASKRAGENFVAINVSAIPDELLEVELFGAKYGAYTGAERGGRVGKLPLADRGTLFLDEIADMPARLQVKLLRALQEREVEPLGSNKLIRIDVRLIAATSRDLERLVAEGRFRADLYYRLNVVNVRIPPLRERVEDIAPLARVLATEICTSQDLPPRELTDDAIRWLEAQPWPGNVRQLRNVIERACVLCAGRRLSAHDLMRTSGTARRPAAEARSRQASMRAAVEDTERAVLIDAWERAKGNKLEMSRQLGMSRSSLYKKLTAFGIGT